jgi:gluconolactonase
VVFPVDSPNGIGLSPDGGTVYWAETHDGRVFQRTITSPGQLAPALPLDPSVCLAGLPGMQLLDSLAVDGDGNVCVATLIHGGITVIAPDGSVLEHVPTGDPLTTNICFGGPDLCTAFITASGTGRLLSMPWPRPGLALAHHA